MNCPHCQAALSEGSRFCGACGRAAIGTAEAAPVKDSQGDWAGREIAGRYRIKSKLGEGGMGAVFKAEQISLKRVVALKLLRPEMVASPTLLRRFNAEAEAVAKLSHPNTVGIYDFGQDSDGTLFIAMELIDGRSLRAALVAEGPLSLGRSLLIAAQVAASLSDAHAAGIVHRDLKPDNIMLQDRGRARDIVRVLDFGIAKLRDDSRQTTQQSMTQAGDVLGTPQYMSPEQIRGEEIDGRSDIYSLGAILYEMVTGRMVFEAASLVAILSKHLLDQPEAPSRRRPELQIPAELDELVLSCLSKDARARPASMERLAERLLVLSQTYAQGGSSSDLLLRQGSLGELASRPPSATSGLAVAPTGAAGDVAPGAASAPSAPPASAAVPTSPPPGPPPPGPPPGAVPTPPPPGALPAAVPTPPPYGAVPTPPPYGAAMPHGAVAPPYASPYPPPYAAPSPYGYAPGMPPGPAYSPVPLVGYPPPVVAPQSSASRVLWIALIVLAVLGAGGGAVYVMAQRSGALGSDKPSAGSDEPDASQSGDSPWSASGSSSGSGSGSGSGVAAGSDPTAGSSDGHGTLAPMSPPRLANVGGRLYTARGFFKLLVPPELSPNPQQQSAPDGSGSVWTFSGDSGIGLVVIASPLPPEVDLDDPEQTVKEFGMLQGLEPVSWSWRDLGNQRALSGIYRAVADHVEMRGEAVLYVKKQGFLVVTFLCPEVAFEASQEYRDVLFNQRVTW